MSRSLSDKLSKDEVRTIANVRRDVWRSGFYGLATGSLAGISAHTLARLGNRRGLWNLPLNRNTALLSFMLGGASGSFIMATATGKNEVHNLHPIFSAIQKTDDDNSPYKQSLQRAKEREDDLRQMEVSRLQEDIIHDNEAAEREERERNRLYRRESLRRSLEEGHGGLSDAHGGHWVTGDRSGNFVRAVRPGGSRVQRQASREERVRNRLYRRESLQRSLEEGHGGLSDAHGGHWVKDHPDQQTDSKR